MKLAILLVFVAIAAASAVPVGPADIAEEQLNSISPLNRVRR